MFNVGMFAVPAVEDRRLRTDWDPDVRKLMPAGDRPSHAIDITEVPLRK